MSVPKVVMAISDHAVAPRLAEARTHIAMTPCSNNNFPATLADALIESRNYSKYAIADARNLSTLHQRRLRSLERFSASR